LFLNTPPDDDNTDEKRICYACVGEDFLCAAIKKEGDKGICSYCGEKRKTITIEGLADYVEVAFGGGCVGGRIWPCKVPSEKDCGGPSTIFGSGIAAGNTMATKLKHLSAQAMDPLQSSGGQHGMSA
jgi:hypothetical protein